jgi:hypothetical protein
LTYIKIHQPDDFDDANFPQARPIGVRIDGHFATFAKDGEPIFRVNSEDAEALIFAHGLLKGVARTKLVPAEVENLIDVLESAIKGLEMGS